MPSFGGEVKPSVPCRALRHVKEPKSDVEVATFGKILCHFSPIVPPSAAGFASVASDAGDLLWQKLERSKSLVLLQVGGLTCRWQRHSVKPSCWECSKIVEQAETHLRVVVPIEEEEDMASYCTSFMITKPWRKAKARVVLVRATKAHGSWEV
jgi:hypothetical protein